jgi:hypothetical protein
VRSKTKPVTTFYVNTALYHANTRPDADHDGIACDKALPDSRSTGGGSGTHVEEARTPQASEPLRMINHTPRGATPARTRNRYATDLVRYPTGPGVSRTFDTETVAPAHTWTANTARSHPADASVRVISRRPRRVRIRRLLPLRRL